VLGQVFLVKFFVGGGVISNTAKLVCSSVHITFLSNGYGEDAIGSRLAAELVQQSADATVCAYPTVDRGDAYEHVEDVCQILGQRQVMPSGGLMLHSWDMFVADMRAGVVSMALRQLRDLSQLKTDVLVVVGDAYALLLSSLVRCQQRFYVQSLVSAYHQPPSGSRANRVTMEQFTGFERWLIRRLVTRMYVRDAFTADTLHANGLDKVRFLGNPMVDKLEPPQPFARRDVLSSTTPDAPVIALLPGTRQYSHSTLHVMLEALCHYPEAVGLLAWAAADRPQVSGWRWREHATNTALAANLLGVLERGKQQVFVYQHRFADILHAADIALGTAGTAHEQAAARGVPVVSFAMPPHYTPAFLENQQRLLADALTVVAAEPEDIARALQSLWQDGNTRQHAAAVGKTRMGKAGGTRAIVADILAHHQ